MIFQDLIPVFGYAAIAAGSFLEGEATLILGGLATYKGYLGLHWVIACAFAGTLMGDQTCFYLGRTTGSGILKNRIKPGSFPARILKLLVRNQVLMILAFRFLYGFRTVILLSLGASRICPRRFFLLNIIGTSIWVITLCVLGYLFGQTLEAVFSRIKDFQPWLVGTVASAGITALIIYTIRRKRAVKTGE